ncbi:hypothetical protein CUMW_030050 [Citrus unshiu]|nr:hypothetical protein CUMW_030050 [Citrus unshiu]
MPDLNLNLSRSKNFFFLPKPFCPLLCENQMQIQNQISFLSNQLRIFSLLTYQFIVPTKTPNTPEEKNGCRQCYQ